MPVPLNGSVQNKTGTQSSSNIGSSMNYIRPQGLGNSSSVRIKQTTTASSSSFSKLRSAFIKTSPSTTTTTNTTSTTTTTTNNNNNNNNNNKNNNNNNNSSTTTTTTLRSVRQIKKFNTIDSFVNKPKQIQINSDDEALNPDKLNSGTSSTISSLCSSDAQTEIDHLPETCSSSLKSSSSSIKIKNENSNSSSPSSHRSSPTSKSSQMPFKIRSSKYRHVYGNPHKEDVCFKNIKITKNAAHDSAFCAVNPKFVSIVTEECGGGAFVVIPIKQTGRVDINHPKVTGHRGPVLDLKWNPFNDNEIASCSEDTTIKVWHIADGGLYENLNEWIVDLHGHQRKVGQIEWHPTAENIMISSSADFQVIVWNLEKAEPIRIISCHNDSIQSMCWNRDGSLFATTCKDKKLRLIDPRTGQVVSEGDGHQGSKISKVVILGCGTKMFTTGFSRLSERQIGLWNIKDLSKPVQMDVVDCSSGILIPYYDYDTKIVFVAGKGDGNIRYYEITDTEPYIHYLSEYKSAAPQRGLGSMPKRGLDVTKNEVYRFYKLHATGGICEPISMIVPRKSEVFQEDIYPDTTSGIPSLSCEEWIKGENRDPILISMKDGAVPFMPKIVTYKQLGISDLNNSSYSRSFVNGNKSKTDSVDLAKKETNLITNTNQTNNKLILSSRSAFNKMSSSSSYSSSPPSSPNQNRKLINNDSSEDNHKLDKVSSNESVNQDELLVKKNEELEASYITNVSKNPITLRKTESLRIESVQSIRNRFDRVNSNTVQLSRKKDISEFLSNNSSLIDESLNITNQSQNVPTGPASPPSLILSPNKDSNTTTPIPLLLNMSSNSTTSQTPNSSCIKKRVWTPVQSSSNLNKLNEFSQIPNNFNDLQKSYFRLLEERNSLKERNKKLEEELQLKDKRISSLEDRLKIFNLSDSNRIDLATDC